jgi:hypothetical protein
VPGDRAITIVIAGRACQHDPMHTGPKMIVRVGANGPPGIGLGAQVQTIADEIEQPCLELPQRAVGRQALA